MARAPRDDPGGGGGRVPLRRLSTKRFKTLGARRADAARRRSRRAVDKLSPATGIDWQDVREARDEGVTWTELSDVLAKQKDLAARYANGEDLRGEGMRFWQSRDPRLPDSMGYYHGLFG